MINSKNIKLCLLSAFCVTALVACDHTSDSTSNNSNDGSGVKIANYEQARLVFWSDLYAEGGNSLYCNTAFAPRQRSGFNIEHVFPMSWATKALACGTRNQCRQRSERFNQIEADLHNLFPTLTKVNAARSFYRFSEIEGEKRHFGEKCDFEVDKRRRLAEPRLEVRGDIARAMFYMAHRYREDGLKVFEQTGRILEKWHKDDLPDKFEIRRNARIESLQGNRNPFIDEPEKLTRLVEQNHFY